MGGNGLELTTMNHLITYFRKLRKNIWIIAVLARKRQHAPSR